MTDSTLTALREIAAGMHPTATPTVRRLVTKKGRVIETTLTDVEALRITGNLDSSFAKDLMSKHRTQKRGLSPDQMAWVHQLAMDVIKPPTPKEAVTIGSMSAVIDMFNIAKKHLKNPKIRLQYNGQPVALSVAGERAKVPGSITVTDGGRYMESQWFGRILRDGTYEPSKNAPAGIAELLSEFAADPDRVASEYGRLTGNCCYCLKTLKDERSTDVGYGPVCARHFGRSWGSHVGWNERPSETTTVDEEHDEEPVEVS